MPFTVTKAMQDGWQQQPRPKATLAQIARVEAELGIRLPAAYVEFVTQFGVVNFGLDAENRCMFTCQYDGAGQEERRTADIAFMLDVDKIPMVYRNQTESEYDGDETLPAYPKRFVPVANDAGQGNILLEINPHPGQVWYWKESEWRWGTQDNTRLGFVAKDFYDFINDLQPLAL